MSTKIVERIAKILNQAENAGTEAEAATFMAKAQQLAAQNSIDLAKARHLTIAKERTVPITRTVTLGERKTRGLNTYVALISGIARANDVKINIAHNSTYVILFGFEEDIDVVEALFSSLLTQMVTATEAFKRQGSWKNDTVRVPAGFEYYRKSTGEKVSARYYESLSWYQADDIGERYVPAATKPVSWLSARLDFQNAFAARIGHRLLVAKLDAEQIAEEADDIAGFNAVAHDDNAALVSTALVLIEKREAVEDHYKKTSTARGSYRGQRRGVVSTTSSRAGREAGNAAQLTGTRSIANKAALA